MSNPVRIGLMGFGRIGRQIYQLALRDPNLEVVAIVDIGRAEILHHLLTKTSPRSHDVTLEGNYLVSGTTRTRLLRADQPSEIPWDVFNVDVVVEATGRFRTRSALSPHIDNGAGRVVMAMPPHEAIDRVVLCGVNAHTAQADDRIVSAGSASTHAFALLLQPLAQAHAIRHASMTSVHAYTSDQILQDYAGADYRRSRSGAQNIIPNETPGPFWVERAMPELRGKLSGYALNVPVQTGSMLDLTVALDTGPTNADAINELYQQAASANPALIQTIDDPIVSSDVRGTASSVLVDLKATMCAGERLVKVIGWHETLGQAHRVIDVIRQYRDLDNSVEAA